MSRHQHSSETPATQWLKARGIAFEATTYDYIDHGGSGEAARQLATDEHAVIKTLVMQDENERPLIILMHGDRQVSTKALAREIGAKTIQPCKPEVAQRHSGYFVGGTSPFGLRKAIPVYVEAGILSLPTIWINGGKRGFLLRLVPAVLTETLCAKPVHCALV